MRVAVDAAAAAANVLARDAESDARRGVTGRGSTGSDAAVVLTGFEIDAAAIELVCTTDGSDMGSTVNFEIVTVFELFKDSATNGSSGDDIAIKT